MVVAGSLYAVALGLLLGTAWFSARSTLYTLTNKRVVMRIGIVLTLTFNLPFKRIAGASLKTQGAGTGDIALALHPEDRIGWAHLWPHQRAWHITRNRNPHCAASPTAPSGRAAPGPVARRTCRPKLALG
jgi:hypothetical protein